MDLGSCNSAMFILFVYSRASSLFGAEFPRLQCLPRIEPSLFQTKFFFSVRPDDFNVGSTKTAIHCDNQFIVITTEK